MYFLLEKVDFQPAMLVYQRYCGSMLIFQGVDPRHSFEKNFLNLLLSSAARMPKLATSEKKQPRHWGHHYYVLQVKHKMNQESNRVS